APPVQEETPQQAAAREDDILREIRQVNDDIPDEAMSAKIDRIEEITGKILKYQKEHPNKEGQLRTFLNYYLPTTLKILRAYAQLDAQGIEGENISAAKKRIEDMMDQVVSGFEKQLDKLFQDDAMDITSDVEVLENMLKKDGLSDEGGITMTL
ncbi:MAG: 5-bromo-4-chloroindolyl phosphate hydrolysis family protein, partial [Oscillospiraceae bacterium]|nr:5-bromo-4-chloroindolyl phosphate hydrolysis family protein [Oscillospiraceae bacterium]